MSPRRSALMASPIPSLRLCAYFPQIAAPGLQAFTSGSTSSDLGTIGFISLF